MKFFSSSLLLFSIFDFFLVIIIFFHHFLCLRNLSIYLRYGLFDCLSAALLCPLFRLSKLLLLLRETRLNYVNLIWKLTCNSSIVSLN